MNEQIDQKAQFSRRRFLGLLASACAGSSIVTPLHARGASDLIPLRMLDTPGRYASVESIYVAEERGFLRKEGLKLELIPLPSLPSTIALDANIVDFTASADYIYIVNVLDKGFSSHQVISSLPHIDPRRANDGLFVCEDSHIQGPKDLRGKKIGMTSVWYSCAWFTREYLARENVPVDDVEFVTVRAPQMEQVLLGKDVDAVFAFSPIDAVLRQKGNFRQLFSTADMAGRRIQRGASMMKGEFIKNNPDIVRRYVTAIANGIEWANRNQGEVVEIGIKLGRLNPKLAPYIYTWDGLGDYSVLSWPEHGVQDPHDIDFWLEMAKHRDIVTNTNLTVQDIYTDEYNPFA